MSFHLPFHYRNVLRLTPSRETVFAHLQDFERSLPQLFPGLKRFRHEGNQTFYWEFEPISYGGKDLLISFRTEFLEIRPFEIEIIPKESAEGTRLQGSWKLTQIENGCRLEMDFHLNLCVPLPKLTKSFVAPLAERELNALFNRYASNIEKTFK